MTREEAGRLGGLAARKRYRWSRTKAREAGSKGGKASAERRRCTRCKRVPSRGEVHACAP